MSVKLCTSCLSWLRLTNSTLKKPVSAAPFLLTSSFHSIGSLQQSPTAKKKNVVTGKHRQAKSARLKKKGRERPRPPAPGERKAQRKRIVLSNTNALEIPGLEYLSKENMVMNEKVGQMLALQGAVLDQLRESKAFKTTQNWNLFRQPSTLMRNDTLELGKDIADVNASREDQGFGTRTISKIITGERGSGKSIHLLQAMSMAYLNNWVVLHIPECQEYTINNFAYTPVAKTEETAEQTYNQPTLASEILSRLATSNAAVLSKLKLNHEHDKSLRVQKHTSLQQLAQIGADEPGQADTILSAVWKELTVPPKDATHTQQRPPLLVTVDGINHWMGPTLYKSSDYKAIHAHQFTLVNHFLKYLFNSRANPLPYGGMILGATSGSNSPTTPSFQLLIDQLLASQNQGLKPDNPNFPLPGPYSKVDQRVLDLFKTASDEVGVVQLRGLTKPESKGLLDYFAQSGVLREKITDTFVGIQWSLAGNGTIGELCRYSARVRV